ncbi:hypothetical protein X976_5603 [Burkholderia pseudomallei MSHR7500]|nr:hypothetical protein DO73_2787 [Burkholderia pseudomallei]KGS85802.1 hypothetical protein X976_5603 [Burkholderia pseudomallei MSHR7500]KGX68164.1 hypothetical protein Y026_5404 [Burkholderia pseudomallei TSV28]
MQVAPPPLVNILRSRDSASTTPFQRLTANFGVVTVDSRKLQESITFAWNERSRWIGMPSRAGAEYLN